MSKNWFMYEAIVTMLRQSIVTTAISMLGTVYGFGCKDPDVDIPLLCSGSIDCSGLVAYVYAQAGIKVLGTPQNTKNAQMQYDYVVAHDGIITASEVEDGDLVFYQNTYDKKKNGIKNGIEDDGITHIGIALKNSGEAISAGSSLGVEFYPIQGWFKTFKSKQDAFVGYGSIIPLRKP